MLNSTAQMEGWSFQKNAFIKRGGAVEEEDVLSVQLDELVEAGWGKVADVD